jgi:hypothetical protein
MQVLRDFGLHSALLAMYPSECHATTNFLERTSGPECFEMGRQLPGSPEQSRWALSVQLDANGCWRSLASLGGHTYKGTQVDSPGKQTKLQWYEGIACSSLTADLTRTLVCVTSERNLSC